MSRIVGPSAQGQLQGGISSLQGIAGMIAPLFYSRLLAAALRAHGTWHVIGAPFYVAAAMLVLAVVLAWRATRVLPPMEEEENKAPQSIG